MSKGKNLIAILLAILAAALYAISTPVSKVMLQTVAPTMVAAFLYLGAGIGMGAMMLVRSGRHSDAVVQHQALSLALNLICFHCYYFYFTYFFSLTSLFHCPKALWSVRS
jgi:drug/metabolite transporter (DMT)-like permease